MTKRKLALYGLSLGIFLMFFKPVRALVPERMGMICPTEKLCLEEPERRAEAEALTKDALRFVETHIAPIESPPRMLFCSSEACARRFGDPRARGLYFGPHALLINPGGWAPHILRHELIHHVQNEAFGWLARAALLPRWYVEGMAYTMSEDPREMLPLPKLQRYRARFQDWVAAGHDWRAPPRW